MRAKEIAQLAIARCKEMYLRRPYGTPECNCGNRFPTLKRGANKRCACGAAARTLPMQVSIEPREWRTVRRG